jgi:hypothetical protein
MFTVMIKPLKHNETPFLKFKLFFFYNHPCYGTLFTVTCIILYVTVKKREFIICRISYCIL